MSTLIKRTLRIAATLTAVLTVILVGIFIYQSRAAASEERSFASAQGTNEQVIEEFKEETTQEIIKKTTEDVTEDTTQETTQQVTEETTTASTTNTRNRTTTANTTNTTSQPTATAPVATPTPAAAPVAAPVVTDPMITAAAANAVTYAGMANEMANQINQYRAAYGLAPLTVDYSLTLASSYRASEMAAINVPSHTRPNGTSFSTVAKGIYGVTFSGAIAENLCNVYSSATAAMNGFKNSATHNGTMLGNYTKVGIGVAQTSSGTYYWVQTFTR